MKEELNWPGDPLNEWHTEPGQESNTLRNDEESLDEDEDKVVENDPNLNYWLSSEDVVSGEDIFDQYLPESISSETIDILKDDFEDRDILKESLAETRSSREAKAIENQLELYKKEELDLMQECFKYQAATKLRPELIRNRPVDDSGRALTDEEMARLANIYSKSQEQGLLNSLPEKERNQLKHSYTWHRFYSLVTRFGKNHVEEPTYADGQPLSEKEIAQQAQEFISVKKEHPEVYASYMHESGKWQKENFKWNEGNFKGKPQWRCIKNISDTDSSIKKVLYITGTQPEKPDGTFYYTVKNSLQKNDSLYEFIEIKYPLAEQGKKKRQKA